MSHRVSCMNTSGLTSGDRGVEKTADEPGPTQPLVLSDLNMRWDLPDHIEECGAAALAAHLRGSHASGCVKNHPAINITGAPEGLQ
jgi:hypothetical protein